MMIENLVRLLEESTSPENDDPYLMTAIANRKLDITRVLATLKDTAKILGNVSKGEILVINCEARILVKQKRLNQ